MKSVKENTAVMDTASKEKKSFGKAVKGFVCSKSFVMFALMAFCLIVPTFAGNSDLGTLDTYGNSVLAIFTSTWLKALACVALIIEAIGMIVAGQQGGGTQIIKKFAPWVIGTVILLSASNITDYLLGDLDDETFNFSSMLTLPVETENLLPDAAVLEMA